MSEMIWSDLTVNNWHRLRGDIFYASINAFLELCFLLWWCCLCWWSSWMMIFVYHTIMKNWLCFILIKWCWCDKCSYEEFGLSEWCCEDMVICYCYICSMILGNMSYWRMMLHCPILWWFSLMMLWLHTRS